MRESRSSQFARRSLLYARYDAQLCIHTRFFAAASLINAVLAKFFVLSPRGEALRSFTFLNEAGAALEMDNIGYAREIGKRPVGGCWDRALVCGEQHRLQRHVHAYRSEQPRHWEAIRGELNGVLNERHRASPFANWCADAGRLSRVLRGLRAQAGTELDFASASHRILIGIGLIESIRSEAQQTPVGLSLPAAARLRRQTIYSAAHYPRSPNKKESAMTRQVPSLTLAEARGLIAAGEKKAQELGIPYNIAVVDAGGGLIAHARMDGAWLGSIDISIHKAWTARAFDMATEDLAKMAQSGKPLFGIQTTNHEKVVIFGGGAPVKVGAEVVGAVGASGGTVDQDLKVAEAAVSAFEHTH